MTRPVFPGKPTPQGLAEKIAAVRRRYPGGAMLTRELAQQAVSDALDLAYDLERVMGHLAEAQITIRAFVEPEAEVKPDGQRIAWRCTGCRLDLDGNPRFCPRCGYTVYAPIRQKDEPPPPAESLTRPPAGDNDSGYSWGPLPHPPWPTS